MCYSYIDIQTVHNEITCIDMDVGEKQNSAGEGGVRIPRRNFYLRAVRQEVHAFGVLDAAGNLKTQEKKTNKKMGEKQTCRKQKAAKH